MYNQPNINSIFPYPRPQKTPAQASQEKRRQQAIRRQIEWYKECQEAGIEHEPLEDVEGK